LDAVGIEQTVQVCQFVNGQTVMLCDPKQSFAALHNMNGQAGGRFIFLCIDRQQ